MARAGTRPKGDRQREVFPPQQLACSILHKRRGLPIWIVTLTSSVGRDILLSLGVVPVETGTTGRTTGTAGTSLGEEPHGGTCLCPWPLVPPGQPVGGGIFLPALASGPRHVEEGRVELSASVRVRAFAHGAFHVLRAGRSRACDLGAGGGKGQ
jgi:hypothetical protein